MQTLNGVETAIRESFDKDVLEKTMPLVRRIRAILTRATVPAPEANRGNVPQR